MLLMLLAEAINLILKQRCYWGQPLDKEAYVFSWTGHSESLFFIPTEVTWPEMAVFLLVILLFPLVEIYVSIVLQGTGGDCGFCFSSMFGKRKRTVSNRLRCQMLMEFLSGWIMKEHMCMPSAGCWSTIPHTTEISFLTTYAANLPFICITYVAVFL